MDGAGLAGDGLRDHRLSVLVVDDHRVFTDGLRLGLEAQPDVRAVTVAHSCREALARARADRHDVAIVDVELGDGSGIDLAGELRSIHPAVRLVVLTAHTRPDLAARARALDAAFLGKDGSMERVLAACRGRATAPVAGVPAARAALTAREHDVLLGLGRGLEPNAVAGELGISLNTVRGHIKALIAKLGVRSQLGAVVAAHQQGLIRVGSRY